MERSTPLCIPKIKLKEGGEVHQCANSTGCRHSLVIAGVLCVSAELTAEQCCRAALWQGWHRVLWADTAADVPVLTGDS